MFNNLKEHFEAYLFEFPLTNSNNLYAPVKYILNNGGKRIRPVLCLIGAKVFGFNEDNCLPAAAAIEYFHNFTLVHDDIMDDADIRRGKQTVHQKFSSNNAILSGDVMIINAYQFLEKYEGPIFRELSKLLSKTAVEVCEGQQLDIDFESRNDVRENEYIEMISLKTSVLIGASLKMGAIIAKASEKDADLIYLFGKNMGISFQLMDDLLDSFGNEGFGKKIGGDIIQNKKTFLLIKALELSNEKQKQEINYWLNKENADDNEKIEAIKDIYKQLNIEQLAREKAEQFHKEAINLLNRIDIEENQKQLLIEFADDLLARVT